MARMLQRRRLGFALARHIAFALAALAVCAVGSAAKASTISDTAEAAHRLWGKLLSQCGPSYFYAGSVFDSGGMLSRLTPPGSTTVLEFRGVKFFTVPVRITDAERMNGVSAHARVSMLAHIYREQGDSWSDGPDLQVRNTKDSFGRAIQDIAGDFGSLGIGGAMAFDLAKIKGAWVIARSSTTMSGPLSFGTNNYDLDKLIAARAAKYRCDTGKVGLTDKEEAARLLARARNNEAEMTAEELATKKLYDNAAVVYLTPEQYKEVLANRDRRRGIVNYAELPWFADAIKTIEQGGPGQRHMPYGSMTTIETMDRSGYEVASLIVVGEHEQHILMRGKDSMAIGMDRSEHYRRNPPPPTPYPISCKAAGAPEYPGPATPSSFTVETDNAVPFVAVPETVAKEAVARMREQGPTGLEPFADQLPTSTLRLKKGTIFRQIVTVSAGRAARPFVDLKDQRYVNVGGKVSVARFAELFETSDKSYILIPAAYNVAC